MSFAGVSGSVTIVRDFLLERVFFAREGEELLLQKKRLPSKPQCAMHQA